MKENKELEIIKETAILVGLDTPQKNAFDLPLEESLQELELLSDTDDIEILGSLQQSLSTPNPRTYIGSGKVDELKMMATELGVDMVIFDDELSPRHQRELEEALGLKIKVIDRTALILDIFARHARTREGQLQVELAQLEYRLPRLTHAWSHLARQTGGGGGRAGSIGGVGLRGPGETQLEVDRREIRKRIRNLREIIDKIRENRAQYRSQRKKNHIPVVALVGYTNSGKSTLLKQLTNAQVYIADQLFATLDPTTRQVELEDGQLILLTDTVGFIQKLPTQLVASFRATLEEITEADLLLHIVDASNPAFEMQKLSVMDTLRSIEASEIPIITVYNKIDLLDKAHFDQIRKNAEPCSVFISARKALGMEDLLKEVAEQLLRGFELITAILPYQKGNLVSIFHEKGKVLKLENLEKGIKIHGYLPRQVLGQFSEYRIH